MTFFSKLSDKYKEVLKVARPYMLIAGPGIIGMVSNKGREQQCSE